MREAIDAYQAAENCIAGFVVLAGAATIIGAFMMIDNLPGDSYTRGYDQAVLWILAYAAFALVCLLPVYALKLYINAKRLVITRQLGYENNIRSRSE